MKKQIFTFGAIAAMATLAPQITAQDAKVEADVDLPEASTRREINRDTDLEIKADADKSAREKVSASDKASGLIGMEVRNRENEKLGEIKDLVLDLNSGKVSYSVLAVGGFLGIGEKLIALPAGSLQVATEGNYLLLNADKAKIQAAPGFAATAWPAPGDPEINRFWRDARATGSPAGTQTERERGDLDVDIKGDLDTDKKIYTDADKDKKIKIEAEKD